LELFAGSEISMSLSGKTVLVTGASAGIGRATAVALAGAGAKILATGRLSLPKTPSDWLAVSSESEHDRRMIAIGLLFVRMLCDYFKSRPQLEAEIVILRHQLNLLQRRAPHRPYLRWVDRALFIWLYRRCPRVLRAITIVRPETVLRWHRMGFAAYWRWKSRSPGGRPRNRKSALLWMYCREIAPFETPTFSENVGNLIARATKRPSEMRNRSEAN
jgi:short chain dehydrogenase